MIRIRRILFALVIVIGWSAPASAVNYKVDADSLSLRGSAGTDLTTLIRRPATGKLVIEGLLSGSADGVVDVAGEYTTIQAADDALDAADGYTLRVKGGQTYAETVTISTNDNTIYFEPLTVMTSLVLSGARNTVIYDASCQLTGALTLSGTDNLVAMGAAANLDGAVLVTGNNSILELGPTSNIATTLGLTTGTDQVFVTGANTQIVGNITISSVAAVFEAGSSANIDGTVAVSGQDATFKIGNAGNLAQTLNITANGAVIDIGERTQIVGALTIGGGATEYRQGANANIDGAVIVGTSASTKAFFGASANFASTLVISSTQGAVTFGPNALVTGAVTMSGAKTTLRAGGQGDFGGIVTLSGTGCSLILENGCDLDGIVVSGANGLVDGGGWDTLVDGTTANIAISVSGAKGIVQNIQAATTAGGGGSELSACSATAASVYFDRVWVSGSNDDAFNGGASSFDLSIQNCLVDGTEDGDGVEITVGRSRVIGNHFSSGIGGTVYNVGTTGDNWMWVANHSRDSAAISINAGAENGLAMANVTDGTVADGSGTSTVPASGTGNEEY